MTDPEEKTPFIDDLPPLREVINNNGLRAEKSFGQNFLLDLNLTRKIARQAGELSGKHVIEIGPGPGGLTRALLNSEAKTVTAIEFDKRCIDALQPVKDMAGERLNLIHGDALQCDLTQIVPNTPRVIIANLPYNIATPLLISWLRKIHEDNGNFDAMVLMFQKEVADRIIATPKDKAYGRLAVISQWLCQCHTAMTLPPSAFTPPPKINSGVVYFKPRAERAIAEFSTVEKITAAAFGQRRKMVRQSLKAYTEFFEDVGIDPTARAENIEVDTFIRLAHRIDHIHQNPQP
jgi:16S rRNA (adenine1518-N6/adenine1519-N6)-dimethyltransferase